VIRTARGLSPTPSAARASAQEEIEMTDQTGSRAPTAGATPTPDVPVVPWPEGLVERSRLARLRRPCILAVTTGQPPPLDLAFLEDWVRVPVDTDELILRRRTLHERWLAARGELWLDEHGLLHRDECWVALSPGQAAVAETLVASAGRVVRRDDVRRAYESVAGPRSDIAVRAVLSRLRPKLGKVGAVLHLLSGGRVLLDVAPFTHTSGSGNTPETISRKSVARSEPQGKEWEWTQEIRRGC
jgi:hypothetical protein